MTDDRCPTCGNKSFRTWREAQMNAIGYMWTRKGSRGMRAYYSRPCGVFHVGTASSKTRRRMTRPKEGERMKIDEQMIERVADAIMKAQDRGRFDDLPPEDRKYMGWGAREEWRRVSRAALEAALCDVEPGPMDATEIRIGDDDHVVAGGVHTSGKNVRLLLDWFFPFGRPVDETLDRLDDHLREHPMGTAREWLARNRAVANAKEGQA